MSGYMLIKCRSCGAYLIARGSQATKRCTSCNKTMRMHYHHQGENTRELRVVVIRKFNTFKEASDALRYVKLPPQLRDPEKTELYHSSMW